MAEVHLLSQRFDQAGAERLAIVLEQVLAANADLGPRWPQIRALGGSPRQLSRDLEQEIDRVAVASGSSAPEIKTLHSSLHRLADTFSRLGSLVETYPS
ncbi:hypothetical protein SAMN05216360_12388 [Methylobacterium phyllostachyos]|uniref:Uncharacterized protein n=1 Tax=Methylobacterium phyllostachyos TaxID=582672 RepID=A0A1H0JU26_9HYPH|nr:hypothetical protein SAMN05216360_12388 [Methylobacterium phyllostachyos]